ncbi:hypothetical protein G6F57_004890 [Rhizopus arrhizus]|uniref:DNA damage-binding protein 1 n=1 Tax=Rhizopus oryzae TaxID=64495 RepID=A0A9P6XCA6_RHIOR|nr:hypothetical protein G6F23_001344 [Rhizopus arrhizus]KAG0813263.1 hypothetical protein G6F20_005706 [Rhizopus arrhizus]KAG0871686.1 hypothetical protein G6F16_005717 [Rhizopus arrhizus]KAG0945124.1 hypothetical protein G6F30_004408 [Rhizopus arrhizus]KAG0987557.1 hypothetical protein G6F29_002423 [Rhizopus arrhizus]
MFAYYRSSCYSTAIQNILKGTISSSDSSDLVLVNRNCLEWYTIDSLPNTILSLQLQQSTFGTVLDSKLLTCHFSDQNSLRQETEHMHEEEVSYSSKIRKHSYIQGQEVLVILSEYGKMVFVTIHNLSENIRRFETLMEIYLDAPGLEYTKTGKKLAIDPYSRAIAVASIQDRFDIFLLDTDMSRTRFDPIIGRGFKIEKGIIWHMEFLYTESVSRDRMLLALVVYNDVEKLCRVVVYFIDASDIQKIRIERIGRLPLESNTPLPVLLIPLQFQFESFVLVTEQQACLLTSDDVACGNVLYPNSPIPRAFGSMECPLFTTFAQHSDIDANYLYLGSAEGHLYKLYIASSGEIRWSYIDSVNPISQSMCMLGTAISVNQDDSIRNDILLYAGECANSQVIAAPCNGIDEWSSSKVIVLQDLINRAPITDVQIMSEISGEQDAFITCSGMGKQGSLTIMTHGVATSTLACSKAQWKGITRLWSINNLASSPQDTPGLLASSPIDSKFLVVKDGRLQDITLTTYDEMLPETIHSNTIYVNDTWFLLRVYSEGAAILMLHGGNTLMVTQHKNSNSAYRIEHATSWQDEYGTYIAVCLLKEDESMLQILSVQDVSMEDNSNQIKLSIDVVQSMPLKACPRTYEHSLIIYSVQATNVSMVQDIHLGSSSLGAFAVPHSAAIVYSLRVPDMPLRFLVGSHQGSLLSFRIPPTGSDIISSEQPLIYTIGTLAVRLSPASHKDNIVYILSNQLWQLRCNSNDILKLEQILLPKFSKPIDAFAPFNCDFQSQGESVAVIADDKLHIFNLNQKGHMNTRRIMLEQTPRKIVYNKSSNYVIVVTSTIVSGTRKNYVRFINPLSGQFLSEYQSVGRENNYAKNDMILSAAEWSMDCKGKQYQYLCIGFGHPKESFHTLRNGPSARPSETSMERGTLVLYRLKTHSKRGPTLKRVWINERLPGGVLSICPYSDGLLFSAGNRLYLYRFDLESGRLTEVSHMSLPNMIMSIYEDNRRICITTQYNSISFYQFNEETNTFEFLKSDINFISLYHSLMLNCYTAVGVSYSGGMVALNDDTSEQAFEKRLERLFAFHFSDVMVKPSLALLRSQHNLHNDAELLWKHMIPWSQNLCKDFSGGMINVYRISGCLYLVLLVLQELLLDFDPTIPLLGSASDFKDWYCQLSGKEQYTIHGDLVESYLRLPFDEQIQVLKPGGVLSRKLISSVEDLLLDSQENNVPRLDDEPEESKVQVIAYLLVNILSGFSRYC